MANSLTLRLPKGAECKLYTGVPGDLKLSVALDEEKRISVASVTEADAATFYHYTNLQPGLYHYAVFLDGYYSLCQVLNYTTEKAAADLVLDIALDKMAGNGYEANYLMLNTQEFIDNQLVSHKDAWGEEYAKLFRTPQFLRKPGTPGRHMQTTNEEVAEFIKKLDAGCEYMHVFSLGKSPKYGYDMPLVLFTKEDVKGKSLAQIAEQFHQGHKPIIQYTAQCHSLEPASCEGALAMMLRLCEDYGEQVLDSVNIYIIPRINPDGAFEVTRVSPTTGEDMNRDYLRTNNAEVRMVIGAYNLFLPEVAIDGHEKKHYPLREDASCCHDMELQTGAGALNHPEAMTRRTTQMARLALGNAAALGLRGHFYMSLASAAGGS
ncbi:MAG: hypothetical protein J6Q54_08330, partial [Oscillospiraceae bacterium]|nr:hypothetical protein [Oscillospiraceae bacterium]